MNQGGQVIRAVFYIGAFFPHPTGATYSATRLAKALREKGVRITFFVDHVSGWTDGEPWEGFPVRVFDANRTGKLRKLASILHMVWLLASGRVPCDIFHIHGGGHMNLIVARMVQWFTKVKVMMKITLDGWDTPDAVRQDKWGSMNLRTFLKLDAVVAMTSGQGEKCRAAEYQGLLRVIPNGVDTRRYAVADVEKRLRLRGELGIGTEDVVVVYIGWLGRRKGTDVLAASIAALRPRHPHLKLMLVGDYLGHERAGNLFETLGVGTIQAARRFDETGVLFTGLVEDAERYLQAADIFAFPSRQEGFGTVQIEAMACGLPCVAFDLPGVTSDIFPDPGCGIRVALEDQAAFTRELQALIEDPHRRHAVGRQARLRAEACFSLPAVAQCYHDLYTALLRRP